MRCDTITYNAQYFCTNCNHDEYFFPTLEGDPKIVQRARYICAYDEQSPNIVVASGHLVDKYYLPRSDPNTLPRVVYMYDSVLPVCGRSIGLYVGRFITHDIRVPRDPKIVESARVDVDEEFWPAKNCDLAVVAPLGTSQEAFNCSGKWFTNVAEYLESQLELPLPYDTYTLLFIPTFFRPHSFGPSMNFGNLIVVDYEKMHQNDELEVTKEMQDIITKNLAASFFGTRLQTKPEARYDNWMMLGLQQYFSDKFAGHWFGRNEMIFRLLQRQERFLELVARGEDWRPLAVPQRLAALFEWKWPNSGSLDTVHDEIRLMKASLVIHCLCDRVGENLFLKFWKKQVRAANKEDAAFTVTTHDMFKYYVDTINDASSERPFFENFFEQFVYGTGAPTYQLGMLLNTKANKMELCLQQAPTAPGITALQRNWHARSNLLEESRGEGLCDSGIDPVLVVHSDGGNGFGYASSSQDPVWGLRIPKPDPQYPEDQNGKFWTGQIDVRVAVADTDKKINFMVSSRNRNFETVPIGKMKKSKGLEDGDESNLPGYVLVDPDLRHPLARIHCCQHTNMWISMLVESNSIIAEWHAIKALQHLPTANVVKALTNYISNESRYYGLRARAIRALVHLHNKGLQTCEALKTVIEFLSVKVLLEKQEGRGDEVKFVAEFGGGPATMFLLSIVFQEVMKARGPLPTEIGLRVAIPAERQNPYTNPEILRMILELIWQFDNRGNQWDGSQLRADLISSINYVILMGSDRNFKDETSALSRIHQALDVAKTSEDAMKSRHCVVLEKVLEVCGYIPTVLPHLQMKNFDEYFLPQEQDSKRFLDLNRNIRRAAAIGRVRKWFYEAYAKKPKSAMLECFQQVLHYTDQLFKSEKFDYSGRKREEYEEAMKIAQRSGQPPPNQPRRNKTDTYLEFEALIWQWEECLALMKEHEFHSTAVFSGSTSQMQQQREEEFQKTKQRLLRMWKAITAWPSCVKAISETLPFVIRQVMACMIGMIKPETRPEKMDEEQWNKMESVRVWKLEESYLMGMRSTAKPTHTWIKHTEYYFISFFLNHYLQTFIFHILFVFDIL